MTVEELIDELRVMPPTAMVEVQIRKERNGAGDLVPVYEFRDGAIDGLVYDLGVVSIRLDE